MKKYRAIVAIQAAQRVQGNQASGAVFHFVAEYETDRTGWELLDLAMNGAREHFPEKVAELKGFVKVFYSLVSFEVIK